MQDETQETTRGRIKLTNVRMPGKKMQVAKAYYMLKLVSTYK